MKYIYLSCHQNKRKYASQNDKLKGTKLLVRNVPFEASVKELRELFGFFFILLNNNNESVNYNCI
jgi:hypothetical protein